MRFGFCASIENAALIGQIGYDYIEPSVTGALRPELPSDAAMDSARQALAGSGLRAEAFNGFLPGDLKVVGESIDPPRQEAYVREAFARAAALGGQIVVFGSAGARRIPDGFDRRRAGEQVVEFLKVCGPLAAEHGVTIALEPLGAAECNFINSVEEAVEIVDRIGHPSVKVLSDLYHVDCGNQSYEETRAAGARLAHVHVAGSESRRAPIRGDTDYLARFFAELKGMAYAGRISVEGSIADLNKQAPEALETLRAAWEIA